MLQELSIKNFAIISELAVTFESGMTVLTGETGAGKSIIIDAVGLLAGGRGSSHFIRTGSDKAVLQGSFDLPKQGKTVQLLEKFGVDADEGSVILQRELYRSGRNVCRVNGMLVNTATLKEIGETIVDIHGQNEHQELMQPDRHLDLLNEYGNVELATLSAEYSTAFKAYQKLRQALTNRNTHQKEWAQRLDMLRFQVKEIEDAKLVSGEEGQLLNQRNRLVNFQKINVALQEGFLALEGGEELSGAVDMSGQAMNALATIADLDDAFKALHESLQSAFYALQDASAELAKQVDLLEFDESKLDEVEQRLEVIKQLERKYGDSEAQVISYYDAIKAELAEMQATEMDEDDLALKLSEQEQKLSEIAHRLSEQRKVVAKRLEKAVQQQLKDLYMEKTVFEVRFTATHDGEFLASGVDIVEFYIQPNPGEAMQPLAKIASGGELSRLMLALKTIFSESQGVTSIIFDEVDTGVSGRVAQAIAEKISGIARDSQVLCITHLPQVAAMSDHHYFISKEVKEKRTQTHITKLNHDGRIDELARMLAGTTITELTLDHARELLDMASDEKRNGG